MRILVLAALLAGACSNRGLDAEAPLDAALFADFAARAPDGVKCGGAICDTTGGKACCEITQRCTTAPCGTGEQRDACDGPEDCPGAACCFQIDPVIGTVCLPSCDGPGGLGVVCHTEADCAPGERCIQLETAGDLRSCVASQ